MSRWDLPLGCLFLVVALVAAALTLWCLDGMALWAGVGVAALFFYAAVMTVRSFERSSPD